MVTYSHRGEPIAINVGQFNPRPTQFNPGNTEIEIKTETVIGFHFVIEPVAICYSK